MNNSELFIDNHCLGETLQLVAVRPFLSADGKRHDVPIGYTYDVCIRAHQNDKIGVKIMGAQQLEQPSTMQDVYVVFDGLRVRPYVTREGRLALTATATGIKPVQRSTAEIEASAEKADKQRH